MTDSQRKKYEEAANKLFPFFDNQPAFNQYMQAKREAFVGGCEFASKEFKDMDAWVKDLRVEELQEKLKKFESMNYAIEVLKNAFDEREIRMRNALKMSSPPDIPF